MTRKALLLSGALPIALCLSPAARAQEAGRDAAVLAAPDPLQAEEIDQADRTAQAPDEIQFSAETLEYDEKANVVTAAGDVRLAREGNRLRADHIVWNRATGEVVATGGIVATNPQGDTAYGDHMELTDSLKDGAIDNMLVVLSQGGRIAAAHGVRSPDGSMTVTDASYTPCSVTDSKNCPKEPSWKVNAHQVVYDPQMRRLRYEGARVSVFNLVTLPLPVFSHPIGDRSDDGFLMPDIRYNRTNGLQFALPYFFSFSPSRDLTVTPRIYSNVLPVLQADYRELNALGAFRLQAYGTYSRRSDNLLSSATPVTSETAFRGYLDGVARYQLDSNWSVSGSLRASSDRTFLRRYEISNDDRLRNNVRVERIDRDSYLMINAWAVQTLRVGDRQGLQPIALPELDYRRRFDDGLIGGKFEAEVNTLAITRTGGQDSQRAFASLRWDLRKLTAAGQELILTAYGRGDLYRTDDTLATSIVSYRGSEGVHARAIGALAAEVRWPLIGQFMGGTQRITPRLQFVATPRIDNIDVPNEDARAVDLEDSNLFALNRFPGYDRFDDTSRITWGLDYALYLPGFSLDANVGQSYRVSSHNSIFPQGTGLSGRVSDIVGRTELRYRDFVSVTHRYRLDKNGLAVRRNEVDMTLGSRSTYALIGYLRLNRNISGLEDLQDREELRLGGRVQIARFWSLFGSGLIDLTDRNEDVLSSSDGFQPVRHRVGITYEDDCLRIGLTWRRDYQNTGDARAGNSFLLTLAFKNLGR